MEKVNLINTLLLLVTISKQIMIECLIIDGEGEFDQYIFALGNNFKTKYDQLPIYYGINQECDNNIKRSLIFEGTTLNI
jgi:hypothetical protein